MVARPAISGRASCFFQAEDGIRDLTVTGVQTCALPISLALGATEGRMGGAGALATPNLGCPESQRGGANTDAEEGRQSLGHIRQLPFPLDRSEERRVGKECRSRWSPYH